MIMDTTVRVGRDHRRNPEVRDEMSSNYPRKVYPYQFLLSSSVRLLSFGETGLVGGLIRLGGLDPGLGISDSHCDELNDESEGIEEEKKDLLRGLEGIK
jgi:hypothetical protein